MPSWISGFIEVLKPLAKFLGLIVDIFRKPLVVKEQEVIRDNQEAQDEFGRTGRPK